jgi:hypothetical protein
VHSNTVEQYAAASRFFTEVVAAVSPDRYEVAWSDEWRVLDLIGHGNRANTLVVEYLEQPMEAMPPGYLEPAAIAARGRAAVDALSDDPIGGVRSASERTLAVIAAAANDAEVGTPFGRMPLCDYLPSRAAELVVHGLDLGTDVQPPDDALRGCLTFLVDRAVSRGDGVQVALALTGRAELPTGFSVY